MVRPRKRRRIEFQPDVTYFKPRGVALKELEEVTLTFDEMETLRLTNKEKLNQEDAAKKMDVHQSTFQRTLTRAREKITDALLNGKAIKIEGGNFKMPNLDRTGPKGEGSKTGRGMGKCSGNENAEPSTGRGCGQGKGCRGRRKNR